MMEIEKKLALADLKTYHQDQKLRTLATNIIKYQNFKSSAIPDEIKKDFSCKTFTSYFSQGLRYIKTQYKNPKTPKKLFQFIDEDLKRCIQPLTPSEKDKKKIYNYKTIKKSKPIKQPVFNIPQQLTQPFEYGIRYKNNIVIADEQIATDFIDTCKSLGIDGVRVVTITVEETK